MAASTGGSNPFTLTFIALARLRQLLEKGKPGERIAGRVVLSSPLLDIRRS
jgi:hypothetical protein